VTADPSHERNVVSVRPQFKKRPRVTAGVLPEGIMTPLDKLEELGSVCIRSTCCRLHNFSSLNRPVSPETQVVVWPASARAAF